MSNAPIISVIIAAYQAQDFIADAVGSALAQNVADIEVLVSTDEPRSAADYSFLAQLDARVRVLGDVPGSTGPGPARNRALKQACGQFIALLDADDLWSPNYLARLVPLAESKGAAFGRTRITNWQGDLVREITAKDDPVAFEDFAIAYGSLHGIVRQRDDRRRIDRHWQDVLAEDVLFDLETLAIAGGQAPFAADAFYQLRLRPTSATRSDRFVSEIGAGYDRLVAMVKAGETLVPPLHHGAVCTVFRSWQKMNAAFEQARAAGDRRDFQAFVAAR